jgi:RNA polymerase sigma-70 factor (ECF subfamily)
MTQLAVNFASHLASASPAEFTPRELEVILERLVEESRAAWPELQIRAEEFVGYLAARVSPDQSIRDALHSLHVTDLYLACGCANGNTKAIAALDAHYISKLVPTLSRKAERDDDEVAQRLRVRTLVGDGQSRPRIASYSGRGPLGKWIRISATRLAVDLHRLAVPVFDAAHGADATASDAERSYVVQRYGNEFAKALESALAKLTKRARTLLHLHFLEEVSVAEIAARQGVTPRTVQRRLAAAEKEIVKNLQSLVAQRLELSSAQVESLLPDVEAELVAVLQRFLSRSDAPPPDAAAAVSSNASR